MSTNVSKLQLEPGQRLNLSDQLYRQIMDSLIDGRLLPGDRLPTERALCTMFGVSRPIVREALLRLRADGLIQSRQGSGTVVISQPSQRLQAHTNTMNIASVLRCIEVRMALEGAAARLAAERRTERQLKRILDIHERFSDRLREGKPNPVTDLDFHTAVVEATSNEFFMATMTVLHEPIASFMSTSLDLTKTGSKERSLRVIEEHQRIVDAIRAEDGDGAALAMQFHINQARQRMIDKTRDP